MGVKDRVITYLMTADRPLSPLEIAVFLKINRNSVRPVVSRLVKEGILQRDFYGHYSTTPTYGVLKPVRVQNLFFVADAPIRDEHRVQGVKGKGFEVRKSMPDPSGEGEFQVIIELGWWNKKINWSVKAPRGLDLYGFRAVWWWVDEACARLGYEGLRWRTEKVEFLDEAQGVRIEGIECVTIEALDGTLEKWYNKFYGVRHEVRATVDNPIENTMALLGGGVPYYQVVQGIGLISKSVERLIKVDQHTLERLDRMERVIEAVAKSQIKFVDSIGDLIKELKKK